MTNFAKGSEMESEVFSQDKHKPDKPNKKEVLQIF
jgi:hypothetical protein